MLGATRDRVDRHRRRHAVEGKRCECALERSRVRLVDAQEVRFGETLTDDLEALDGRHELPADELLPDLMLQGGRHVDTELSLAVNEGQRR